MKKQEADESSIYFKCDHCSQEFTLYSFRIAVFLYGVILLADEHNGFVGIVCPKCMLTTLRKVKKKRLRKIRNDLGDRLVTIMTWDGNQSFGQNVNDMKRWSNEMRDGTVEFTNMQIVKKMASSPTGYVLPIGKLKYDGFDMMFSLPDSANEITFAFWKQYSGRYARHFMHSWLGKTPTDDYSPVYLFRKDKICKILHEENNEGLKMFPRLSYDNSIRTSCDEFLRKMNLRLGLIQEKDRPAAYSLKKQFSVNYSFLEVLDDEDFLNKCDSGIGQRLWNMRDPLEGVNVPGTFEDLDQATIEKQNKNIGYRKMVREVWSNFTKDHVQKILSKMLFEFSLEFRELKNRKNCSTGAIWELKQKYLTELYDSLSSPTKRRKIAKQTRPIVLKEVKKAEEKFPSVKIISQDYRIDEIKLRIANHYVRPEKGRIDILILGETGTGKDLIANACHEASGREGQFIKVNAPAIPSIGLESELFGHARGAFTDAKTERKGKFKEANKGTIFLDEIGEMDIKLQSKLLRVIENREIQPLGKDRTEKVDVMLIMATNKDLRKCVKDKSFREDLFYRISSDVIISIPPLRDRQNDIPLLINHFIQEEDWKRKQDSNLPELKFSKDCLKVLKKMPWKGNIRELENMVGRIVVNRMAEENRGEITEEDISTHDIQNGFSLKETESRITADKYNSDNDIISTLQKNSGNRTHTAKQLGMSPRQVFRRIKEMEAKGIEVPPPLKR